MSIKYTILMHILRLKAKYIDRKWIKKAHKNVKKCFV